MGFVSGIVTFLMIWWVTIFVVLPFNVQPQKIVQKGNADGAPEKSYMKQKLLITTGITIVLWSAFFYIIENKLIGLGDIEAMIFG